MFGKAVTDPNQHPFHEIIDGMNFVLVAMAFLSLILGLFLIFSRSLALFFFIFLFPLALQQLTQRLYCHGIVWKTPTLGFIFLPLPGRARARRQWSPD
jgi:ABC-type multidrug transport system permease subunit